VVRVDLIGHHQLQTEAQPKGPRHGPLLAMTAGQHQAPILIISQAEELQQSQKLGRVR
jgi:hypothetical protein